MRPLYLRLTLIVLFAGLGLATVGVALVPAALGLARADNATPTNIDLGPLDQRSYVYASDGSVLATLQAEIDRQPVPLKDIPSQTVNAVLSVEDAQFFIHDGVNIRSTLRALVRNVDQGEVVQGGSTITQQVVKAEFGDQQTVGRKAREAMLARRLEELMTKDQILERYLNTVYFGNGAYGVQAGAETYFGVEAELDIGQSAFLAGMIANPSQFDPIRHPEAARQRRDIALERLVAVERLTPAERAHIDATSLPSVINQFSVRPTDTTSWRRSSSSSSTIPASAKHPRSASKRSSAGACGSTPPSTRRPSAWPSSPATTCWPRSPRRARRSGGPSAPDPDGRAPQRHRRGGVRRAGHRRRAGHGRRRRASRTRT